MVHILIELAKILLLLIFVIYLATFTFGLVMSLIEYFKDVRERRLK